jgi:membrane protease YdiL (CAAX protease family)
MINNSLIKARGSTGVERRQIAVAWFAITISSPMLNFLVDMLLSISNNSPISELLPDIVSVILLGLLSVALSLRPDLRPIRGLVISLFALSFGYLLLHLLKASPLWTNFRDSVPTYQWTMVNSLLKFIPTFFILMTAFARGHTRKSLFLTKGDLSAWRIFTPISAAVVMCMTGGFLLLRLDLSPSDTLWARLLEALPIAILFPIWNSITEEVRYRNVLLAEAETALGSQTALWMTTLLFGLPHFGTFLGTSGDGGTFLAGLAYGLGGAAIGWILGKSILETRGVLAAWIIHAAADLVIILGYILGT